MALTRLAVFDRSAPSPTREREVSQLNATFTALSGSSALKQR